MEKGKFLEALSEAATWFELRHQVKFETQPHNQRIRLWFEGVDYCPIEAVQMHQHALNNFGAVTHPYNQLKAYGAGRALGLSRIDSWEIMQAADFQCIHDKRMRDNMLEVLSL